MKLRQAKKIAKATWKNCCWKVCGFQVCCCCENPEIDFRHGGGARCRRYRLRHAAAMRRLIKAMRNNNAKVAKMFGFDAVAQAR